MSALAAALLARGHKVSGSDRNHDKGLFSGLYDKLQKMGVKLYPQDGSGLQHETDFLVISSAVEPRIPDVEAAREQGISVIKRAELLAEIVNEGKGIAVGGTSGKSTVTGMIGYLLDRMQLSPTVVNGAVMLDFQDQESSLGNAVIGQGDYIVYEADESDGSIALYNPAVAVLNNVSEDHKSLDDLRILFRDFVKRASAGAVLNLDCPEVKKLVKLVPQSVTYSLHDHTADVCGDEVDLNLQVPGRHNRSNALAALACCRLLGLAVEEATGHLASFKGIKSRLEKVGTANGVTVIDDFAHNPDKIRASLEALKEEPGRLIVMYQPHGYAPTKMHKDELVEVFTSLLDDEDALLLTEIFYAGGTADQTISSKEIVDEIVRHGGNAMYFENKDAARAHMQDHARPGDRIVIMGARDDSLREMAQVIYHTLQEWSDD